LTDARVKASVVIPTLNAGPEFLRLLRCLRIQETNFEFELVVVDSGSTDGTVELAERYGAEVHRIDRGDFNHGVSRNLGISLARGEYVVLTVQDAVPFDRRWLSAMVEDLERDGGVAGVYGRQIPHLDAGPLTRAILNGQVSASSERTEKFLKEGSTLDELTPRRRRRICAFDNVSSCIRRSVWEELPFEKTAFGEDLRWGKQVIEAGYKLVYEPASAVFHSHERGPSYDLRRYYVDQKILLELFGLRVAPKLPLLMPATLRSSALLYRLLRQEEPTARLRDALLAVGHSVPAQLGTFAAACMPRVERLSPGLHESLDRHMSSGT
jgi:rhamnosyltransferase